jgi:hypothetical protein
MKQKSLDLKRFYLKDGRIAPTKALVLGFLGMHFLFGLLHFPLYLLSEYGTVLPTLIDIAEHMIYPLTAVIGFMGVLACMQTKFDKNRGNPSLFWWMIIGGEAISSLLVALIERFDAEYYLYYWYVVLGNAVLDTLADVAYVAAVCLVLHTVFRTVAKRSEKGNVLNRQCVAVGIGAALYLFASEVVYTYYFFMDFGLAFYFWEFALMVLVYAVYGLTGWLCYRLTRRGVRTLLQNCI